MPQHLPGSIPRPNYQIDVNDAWNQRSQTDLNSTGGTWGFNQGGQNYWATPIYGAGSYQGMDNYTPGELQEYRVTRSLGEGHDNAELNGTTYDRYDARGNYLGQNTWSDLGDANWLQEYGMFIPFLMAGGMAGLQAMGFGGFGTTLGADAAIAQTGGIGSQIGSVAPSIAETVGAGITGAAGTGATTDVAVGNGAFLGEGVPSGVPAWDAAAGRAGVFGASGVFNAAQDSQIANDLINSGTPGFEHVGTNALDAYQSNYGSVANPVTGQPTQFSGSTATPPPGWAAPPGVGDNAGMGPGGNPNNTGGPTGTPQGGGRVTPPTTTGGDNGNGSGFQDLLALIAGITGANAQDDSADELLTYLQGQQAKIDNLYTPGSPEFDYLWEQMSRADAAAGRNSQYGPRSVEMGARIAQTKADQTARMTQGIAPYMAFAMNQDNNQYAQLFDALGGIDWDTFNISDLIDDITGIFS